jgi:DNA polymerase
MLHIDFETRSPVDLLGCGAHLYAREAEILCMAWAVDNDPPEIWLPWEELPGPIWEYFHRGERRSIYAHNAQFERLINWHCAPFPKAPLEAFYCTAAQARANALPGALDDLARAIQSPFKKDRRGIELIRQCCIPPYNEDPELLRQLYEYCKQDVVVERHAALYSHPLSEEAFEDYLITERINDRGLKVDLELAEAAAAYAEEERDELNARIARDGITTARQFQKIKDWVLARQPELEEFMVVYKGGERKLSLDAAVRFNILQLEELDDEVRELLELCDEAGRSSVHKFKAMVKRAGADGRVRGAYIFSGAGQTGRFSSSGLQVQNFTRKCAEEPEETKRQIIKRALPSPVMDGLASMLRPAIVAAPRHSFVCGDWASIEAVILPWLAQHKEGVEDWRAAFAGEGDVYVQQAENMTRVTGIEYDRQVGKVAQLSLGYQGGWRAFKAMARNYGVHVDRLEAEQIKDAWRAANRWCVYFWQRMEHAAMQAYRNPGEFFKAGRVQYVMEGSYLMCVLPSGRCIYYPAPKLELNDFDYQGLTAMKASWKPKAGEDDWPRVQLYGGLLTENADQATAADLLRETLRGMEMWNVVGHTHDEILLEVPNTHVELAREELAHHMTNAPDWAEGLPIAVEVWTGERYRK